MASCASCGQPVPDDQGSTSCSMCYGDPGHGKDGYYQAYLDEWFWRDQEAHANENVQHPPGEDGEPELPIPVSD